MKPAGHAVSLHAPPSTSQVPGSEELKVAPPRHASPAPTGQVKHEGLEAPAEGLESGERE